MESGDEDDVSMNDKNWEREADKLYKEGFREGVEKGREANLQRYFNILNERIEKHHERLGYLVGLACHAHAHSETIDSTDKERLKNLITDVTTYVNTFSVDMPSDCLNSEKVAAEVRFHQLEEKWEESFLVFQQRFKEISRE